MASTLFQRRMRSLSSSFTKNTTATTRKKNGDDEPEERKKTPRRIRLLKEALHGKNSSNKALYPLPYEEQQLSNSSRKNRGTTRNKSTVVLGRATYSLNADDDAEGIETKKIYRSRSMSPFRFLQREVKKKSNNDDPKGLPIDHEDGHNQHQRRSHIKSLSNRKEDAYQKNKPWSLRSRSFSPFRSRPKANQNYSTKEQDELTRKELYHVRNPTFDEKLSNISNGRILTKKKGRKVLVESRNPTPDVNMDRELSMSRRTKSNDGRPPTMRGQESYSKLSRGSSNSMSMVHTMHHLEPSMSFESVMAYPPSKLIMSTSRKYITWLEKHFEPNSVTTEREPGDHNETESKTKVDDSTFSKYDNVLVELQNQNKYKKLWKRSFLKNDQKMLASTSSTTGGALDRPFQTLDQQPRRSSSRLHQLSKHHYISPYDEDLPQSSEEELDPPIVEKSEGRNLGNKDNNNQNHNSTTTNNSHITSDKRCYHRNYQYRDSATETEKGGDHHCSTAITNTVSAAPITTTTKRQKPRPTSDRQTGSPRLETITNAQQITQPLTVLQAPKTKSIITTEERAVLRPGRKSLDKKIKPRKKMSTAKSKSIRRLFKPQSQDDRTIKQKEDRRRNFAFMKTNPNRRKVSTATLERTRARAKQLAEFVITPGEEYQESESQDFFSMYADDLDETLENQPFTSNGLNFSALDNESVISGYSTVYDMDTFDESSIYPSRNTSMRGGRHSLQKDRLWNFNQSPTGGIPHYSTDSFSSTAKGSFEPSSRLIGFNDQLSMNSLNYSGSESGLMSSYFGMPHSSGRINHSTRSSAASVISTSSSVSGPASRRLMRRGMNIVRNQQHISSNDSVASEGNGNQYFGNDESSEKGYSMQVHENMDRRLQPSVTQPRDDGSNFGFTFNAFGLNEDEIDNDVNAAIAELAETDPDISMFMQTQPQDIQNHKSEKTHLRCSVSAYSGQENPRHGTGQSATTDKEVSVASSMTKSSESENMNSPTARKKADDITVSRHSQKSDYPPNEIMRHRHQETFRNVKERIKARQIQSSDLLSKSNNTFQSTSLPDVGSSDSEDVKSACDLSENNERESYLTPQSDARDRGRSFLNNQRSVQNNDERKITKSEQLTISSEETESSNEVIQFIPRQKNISQHESLSQSQKRAQSWASERLDPIIISPLLIPKSGQPKKTVTPSQRRAKDWANEHSSIHNHFFRNSGDSKQEVNKYTNIPRQTSRQESNHRVEIRVPSPEPTFVGEDESTSFTSDDLEVQAITKGAQQIRKISEIGQRLPMPTEKVELRPTASPISQPDYEKYKSTAPSVPLRKVLTNNAQRSVKEEDTNFLANVKLRKVSSPAPRVEQDKMNSPYCQENIEKLENCSSKEEFDRSPSKNIEQGLFGPAYLVARPTNLDLDFMPSDEISDSDNYTEKSNLSREAATKKHCDNKRTVVSHDVSSPPARIAKSSHQSSKNLPPHPQFSIRDETDQRINQSRASASTSCQGKEERSISHPLANLFVSKSREDTKDHTKQRKSIVSQEMEHMSSTNHIVESRTCNGKEVLHTYSKQEKPNKSFTNKENYDRSSLNPVAQLFATRSKQLVSQRDAASSVQRDVTSSQSRNSIASNHTDFSSRSKESAQHFEHQSDDSGNTSLDNIASLFAKKAALLSRSSTDGSTNDCPEKSKFSLVQERKQKSDVKSNSLERRELENKDFSKNESSSNAALKDDPTFQKYFKMLKMGFPMEVVKHALTRDGFDPSIIDSDNKKPTESKDNAGIPLKEDPRFAKYFKMLKLGLPLGAVKNAMERDGEDPSIMDGDHNAPAHTTMKVKEETKEAQPKDKYRRTRVHWDTLGQVKSTSVWAMVNQDPDVEDIEIDESEFAELFQAEVGQVPVLDSNTSKKVNAVKVIDPKRANNGGIVLARLKITYEEMAVAIDTMNDKVMNVEQVQGILEYIPTKDEKQALRKYMNSSHKDSADAFDDLSECEKFMVAMMTVKHSKEKVRALLFKLQFRQCVSDLETDVGVVEKACDELKNSVRLRKLLGIVLNIGNRLNTAGPTKKGKAGAFTIESLLKLNQAKAFDKKTTFLHYIVLIVMRHNESLTNFKDDLPSVMKADKIYWDQIENDLEEVENQLENVRKIALHEVFGKKKPSWARKKKGDDDDFSQDSMSLEEEVEALRSTRIGIFTLQAIKIVSALREQVEGTRLKFRKLLEYFGEDDRKKMNPHELFEIICIFAKDFNQAKEAVLNLEKEKVKRKRQNDSVRSHSPSDRSRDSSYSRCSKDKSLQSDRTSYTQHTQTPMKRTTVPQNAKSNRSDQSVPSNLSSSTPGHSGDSMIYELTYDMKDRESKRTSDSKFIANGSPGSGISSDSRFHSNDRGREEEFSTDSVEFVHQQTNGKTISPSTQFSTSDMENTHLDDPGLTVSQRESFGKEKKKKPPTPERTSSPRERIMSRRERLARRQRGGTRQYH